MVSEQSLRLYGARHRHKRKTGEQDGKGFARTFQHKARMGSPKRADHTQKREGTEQKKQGTVKGRPALIMKVKIEHAAHAQKARQNRLRPWQGNGQKHEGKKNPCEIKRGSFWQGKGNRRKGDVLYHGTMQPELVRACKRKDLKRDDLLRGAVQRVERDRHKNGGIIFEPLGRLTGKTAGEGLIPRGGLDIVQCFGRKVFFTCDRSHIL